MILVEIEDIRFQLIDFFLVHRLKNFHENETGGFRRDLLKYGLIGFKAAPPD